MSKLATVQFLDHLKSIYPSSPVSSGEDVINNPVYIVAAAAFSAGNKPAEVPAVFKYALEELKSVQTSQDTEAIQQQLRLARKIRESVLQSGLLNGVPKVR